MQDFTGQVAVITGAGKGLGRDYALHLASAGAKVIVGDIAAAEAASVVDEINSADGVAVADTGNMAVEQDAAAIVAKALDRYGRIDILINNAGNTVGGKLELLETAQFQSVIGVHVYGSFWTMRAALTAMREAGYGRIINTVSALGAFGYASAAPYATAKAALIGMTKSVALENLDMNIRVNAIAPIAETALAANFFAANPTLNANRFATRYVTPAVAFLSHNDCRITGQVLSAGGGRYASFLHGTGPGIFEPGIDSQQFADQLPAILGPDDLIFPASAKDEFIFINV